MYRKLYKTQVQKKIAVVQWWEPRHDASEKRTQVRCSMAWGPSIGGLVVTLGVSAAAFAAAFAAAPLSPAALETHAGAEFAAAGMDARERLLREAAGDLIGAQVAARNADAHRRRYLDLEHEIERLRSPPVAVSRDPFVPDASFGTLAPAFAVRGMLAARVLGNTSRVASVPWDLYERRRVTTLDGQDSEELPPHLPTEVPEVPRRTAGDMYTAHKSHSPGATDEGRLTSSARERPREPLRVYRERGSGDDPSE